MKKSRLFFRHFFLDSVPRIFTVLEHYSRLIPDAPERVFRQFELNSEAERSYAFQSLEIHKKDNQRRDWMAFFIIMGGLVVAIIAGWLRFPWLSGATIATIIGYAVLGYLRNPPKKHNTHDNLHP